MIVFYDWPFPLVHFAKNVANSQYYFPFYFLAQFSAIVSSFMGISFNINNKRPFGLLQVATCDNACMIQCYRIT